MVANILLARGTELMDKTSIKLVFSSVALALSANASAEWYLGVDQIPASNWYQINDYSINTSSIDFDTPISDPGFKLYSGFKAHEFLTLEFEYKDQMEFGVGNVFSGRELWLTNDEDVELDNAALFFSGSSTFVIDEGKRINFRGGLYNWDLKPSGNYLNDESNVKRHGTDIFYSIGSYFDVTEKIGFSAEWERFEFENEDVDFISTEIRFNF